MTISELLEVAAKCALGYLALVLFGMAGFFVWYVVDGWVN